MKPFAVILLVTVIGLTWSCKKDVRPNEGTQLLRLESTYKNGSYWTRVFKRNPSDELISLRDSTDNGTLESMSFEYGANGKVSKANFLNNQGQIMFHYAFEYNANGRMSKRLAVPGILNIADDINIYTYDGAGRLVSDSQYYKSSMPPYNYQLSKYFKYTYTGNNVTESENYSFITGSWELSFKQKFEYDDKVNPYKMFEGFYAITDDIRVVSAANVTKEYAVNTNGVAELMQVYKYTYNSSGNPWKVRHEIDHNNQGLIQGEYFYK